MMQIQELAADGLKREFRITVAPDAIEEKLAARLAEIGQKARLDGFRPGKIPMPVLRKRYGDAALEEIIGKTVEETSEKAINDRGLRAATQPRADIEESGAGKPLAYKMSFEIMPEIALGDFSAIRLEKLVTTVDEAAVEDMIARVARTKRGPESLEAARPAQKGDVLLIDFEGTTDGKPHPGMSGKNHRLELGTQSFIDTFEDQLVGKNRGDEVLVKVTFPEAYHAAELAGKPAEFQVVIKDIMAFPPVVPDDALAKEIGFESMDEFRSRVRTQMQQDHDQMSRGSMKRQLLDQLAKIYDFAVPEGLVNGEFNAIWERVEAARARGAEGEESGGKSEDEQRADYRAIAERRVRLGLLFAELGRARDIKADQAELREALMGEVRKYPGKEKEVFDYYTRTPGMLDRLRAPILEEKIVDILIAEATVTEKQVGADALLAMPEWA